MALTQSARLPGPSWDEEVVPALRKRLENESRTLARRMSAISMSSNADDNSFPAFASSAAYPDASSMQTSQNASHQQPSSSGQRSRPGYQYHLPTSPDHPTTPTTSSRVNGVQSARKPVATTPFHRSRTYSQPYGTDNSSQMNGSARTGKPGNGTPNTPTTPSRSPRLTDAKPTRIPIASRVSTSTNSPPLPSLNGVNHSTIPTPTQTPNLGYPYNFPNTSISSSQVTLGPSQPSRIINEPPPFNTAASSNSSIHNIHEIDVDDFGSRQPNPRASIDSEERPYEHWYRGEVSRNGGVGELRVGRRQEMLEIANYGHSLNNKRKAALATRKAALLALEDSRRMMMGRKRADSIAGIGVRERGSLYLDEERAAQIGRVLDEDPLTDLDGEGSDVGSISTHNHHALYRYSNHNTDYDFIPGVGDITATTGSPRTYTESLPPQSPIASPEASIAHGDEFGHEGARSDTPTQQSTTPTQTFSTPTAVAITPATPSRRSKSRQSSSSSRIPTRSSERRSSESRVSTPSQHSTVTSGTARGQQQPQPVVDLTTITPVPATTTPPPPPVPPPTRSPSIPSTPSSTKRGVSPGPHNATSANLPSASKKARTTPTTPAAKTPVAARQKPKSALKKPVSKEDRRSIAQYPSPGGDGDDEDMDMADAIPSWTQPKPREGNWDDVVLPVVARKKGLDDQYEKADGSPQPKKKEETPIAPAPGTFGYDGTKIRRGRTNDNEIEMDEFGVPAPAPAPTIDSRPNTKDQIPEEPEPQEQQKAEAPPPQEAVPVPVNPLSSSAPFSDYAPTTLRVQHVSMPEKVAPPQPGVGVEEDDNGSGCCKCVIM